MFGRRFNRGMDNTKNNRYLNMLSVVKNRFDGKAGQCADAIGVKRPHLSRWLTKNEDVRIGISEETARKIEIKLGMPPRSLDATPSELVPVMSKSDEEVIAEFAWVYQHAEEDGRSTLLSTIAAVRKAYVSNDRRSEHIPVAVDRRR